MSKQIAFRIYGISLAATLCLLSIYIFLNHHYDGSIWQTMQQSKSALTGEYCEQDNTSHFFRQRMNTYSNLLYFFLGSIVVLISIFDRRKSDKLEKNSLQLFPSLSFFFGCCLMYLCFGSSFFHASLTWVGQRIDMNGTYSLCITLIAISSLRLFVQKEISSGMKCTILFGLLLTVIAFVELHLLIPSTILLPVLISCVVTATTLNYLRNKEKFHLQPAVLSLILMVAAAVLRSVDVQKIACDPTSIYQGHSLWHIFTGMSGFLLYWFYRSEASTVIPNEMRNLDTN